MSRPRRESERSSRGRGGPRDGVSHGRSSDDRRNSGHSPIRGSRRSSNSPARSSSPGQRRHSSRRSRSPEPAYSGSRPTRPALCQLIVLGDLERYHQRLFFRKLHLICFRKFVWSVEDSLRDASIRVDITALDSNAPVREIIQRMVADGVAAIVFLERYHEAQGTMNIQLFGGPGGFRGMEEMRVNSCLF